MRWTLTVWLWLLAGGALPAAPAGQAPGEPSPAALDSLPLVAAEEEARPAATPATGAVARAVSTGQVLLPEYTNYLARLRAAGCPEHHVRHIIVSDLVAFFDKLRVRQAVNADFDWWKPDIPAQRQMLVYNAAHRGQENLRAKVLERLLGTNAVDLPALPPMSTGLTYNLTGPVLGALPLETYTAVVEVCQRSKDLLKNRQGTGPGSDQGQDTVEQAQLRNQTRLELGRFLTPAQLEEFLLRNSHNADVLRENLRGFNPTREEFLSVFRALDPIQHQMQLEYGSEAALSSRQREEYERQCRRAVQEVLPPDRFQTYLLTLDPFWRRASQEASPHHLDPQAVLRLSTFYRAQDEKKEKIKKDTALTDQQKALAVRQVLLDEGKFLADLVEESRRAPK